MIGLVAMLGSARTLLALSVLATACASPAARRIVGPDGSPMAHVSCGSDQAECFRLAGELCPSGYEMQPVLSGNHGNFLVRCRHTAAVAYAGAGCPTSAAATPPAASASNAGWPAASEPWPANYAWPPPETSAGVRQVPATPAGGELDLGY
jgi:hypothetical protein